MNKSDKFSDYKFSGKKSHYPKFKDKLLGLLDFLDNKDMVRHVEDPKKVLKPIYTRVQVLQYKVIAPPPNGSENHDIKKTVSFNVIVSEVRNILNVVLPSSFSTDYNLNKERPCKIWQDLERRYGTSTSMSIVNKLTSFDLSTGNISYDNVDELMDHCRKTFNELNNEMRSILKLQDGSQPLPEELCSFHVLRCLPRDKLGIVPITKPEHYKMDNLFKLIKQHVVASKSIKPKSVTSNVYSRKSSLLCDSTTKKRKAQDPHGPAQGCFYCFSPDHKKADCLIMQSDRSALIFKNNVRSLPSKRPATAKQVAASKQVNAVSSNFKVQETTPEAQFSLDKLLDENLSLSDTNLTLEEGQVINDLYNSLDSKYTNYLWVLDTGAGKSITGLRDLIKPSSRNSNNSIEFQSPLPGTSSSSSEFSGTVSININTSLGSLNIEIPNVYYVPNWENNIISLHALRSTGFQLMETRNPKFLLLKKNKHLVVAREIDGIYYLQSRDRQSEFINNFNYKVIKDEAQVEKTLKEWHIKLGHVNRQSLIKIMSRRLIVGIPFIPSSLLYKIPFFCKVCAESKHNRMSYKNKSGSRPDKQFQVVHSDTMKVERHGTYGKKTTIKFIQNFVDDCTSYKWIFLESQVNGVTTLKNLKFIQAQINSKFDSKIKVFRSDNGTEYINEQVKDYLNESGIDYQESNVECQEENGSSERYNQTLLNYARSLLLGAGMTQRFWPEAVAHAHYLLNRLPTKRLKGKSPHEVLFKEKPNLTGIPIWGAACYAHIPNKNRPHKKLAARATRCRFLGLDMMHKDAYRLYNNETHAVFVSRDVKFNTSFKETLIKRSFSPEEPLVTRHELESLLTEAANSSEITGTAGAPAIYDAQTSQSQVMLASGGGDQSTPQFRQGDPLSQILVYLNKKHREQLAASNNFTGKGDVLTPMGSGQNKKQDKRLRTEEEISVQPERKTRRQWTPSEQCLTRIAQTSSIINKTPQGSTIKEPLTLSQALSSAQKQEWSNSTKQEYDSLIENKTWELVQLPSGKKALSNKWVFRVKYNANGTIEKYKSRLVVKGYLQREGIDYDEIFSPVIRLEALRLMLAIATIQDLEIHQMDVATAFLNGEIDTPEPIYMKQPEGFHKGPKDQVCRLKKSLYGLKQAPRIWYQCLHNFLQSLGFERCQKEYCIYVTRVNNQFAFICVYVDDLTIICKDPDMIRQIKQDLNHKFKMTDLGEIHYLLRIKISRDRANKRLMMNQEKYINDLVHQYKLENCEIVENPQAVSIVLTPDKASKEMDKYPYPSLVGSLQYIIRGTRPDIANAVRELAKYTTCYNRIHWKAALRVLKYLKHTSTHGLVLSGQNKSLDYLIYTDASFGNANEERKSVLGYCLMLAGAAITYKSSRASQIHLSTCEAEVAAAVEGVKESEWLFELFKELGLARQGPITLFCDNNSAIAQIKNPCSHFSNKHIEIKQLYAREKHEEGRINVLYCPTDTMLADVFTKALPLDKFKYFRQRLGVMPTVFNNKQQV